jgi:hypothetical protein
VRRAIGRLLSLIAAIAPVAAAAVASSEIPNDVYVWQRHWTPAVRTALAQSQDVFAGVRVLVAQAGRGDRWATSDVRPRDFARDRRPLIAVVRYDGVGRPPDVEKLDAFLLDLLERWRAAGHPFAGVEVDYDCGTKSLADYAQRLRELRRILPPGVALSVTALPAWIGSRGLDSIIDATDETVLQLHALGDGPDGLFDRYAAVAWTRDFAREHAKKPFRISLPAYGYRVRFDEQGNAYAVEGEMPVDAVSIAVAREFAAEPRKVAGALLALEADPPPLWRGVVWFRLPVEGDRRAWTLAAIRDVIAGHVPEAHLSPLAVARDNGATDVYLVNDGDADAKARAFSATGDRCVDVDATGDWRFEDLKPSFRFVPGAEVRIRAHSRSAVGWVRCAGPARVEFDID